MEIIKKQNTMCNLLKLNLIGGLLTLISIAPLKAQSRNLQILKSPNGDSEMTFTLNNEGTPLYSLAFKGKTVIKPSKLGLELAPEVVHRDFDDFAPAIAPNTEAVNIK